MITLVPVLLNVRSLFEVLKENAPEICTVTDGAIVKLFAPRDAPVKNLNVSPEVRPAAVPPLANAVARSPYTSLFVACASIAVRASAVIITACVKILFMGLCLVVC
jgi:hypothetical protein